MTKELPNHPLVGSLEKIIAEVLEGVLNPSVTLIFGAGRDGGVCCADKKLTDLLKGLNLLNIHDDVHPAIMDEVSLIVEC